MTQRQNPFGGPTVLSTAGGDVDYFSLSSLASQGGADLDRLPMTVKLITENLLRRCDGETVTEDHVLALARWDPASPFEGEVPFLPARVILQDFTGVPAVVDLAAMRSAMARMGGDPQHINPLSPVDLVIDHSVQVDESGSSDAFRFNVRREYQRNKERYGFLRWAQESFENLRIVPPGTGIVHQVNLEYLATVVATAPDADRRVAFPDTLVGTDSHTTMINGLGVLGWGVGGIEAEAVMLGQPIYLLSPTVVGVVLTGSPREGVTATDLVLSLTERLRGHGVVGKFVEFAGPGLGQLSLADRATLANMAPEYGATTSYFPVDDDTLRYLRVTGRDAERVDLVERYCREQGLFRDESSAEPSFSERLEFDLGQVEPSLAGPRRPQDRVSLGSVKQNFREAYPDRAPGVAGGSVTVTGRGAASEGPASGDLTDGSVAIAAITSCTNTSNPAVMVAAGLLAKNAVEAGLRTSPLVKSSLAPGSRVVTQYLDNAGLTPYLEELRFHLVGYGCTTCLGNSGPLAEPISEAIKEHELVVAAVLSGNRNFEGRIHPLVRAAYLASPPLVVAYALAGSVDVDLTTEPLGLDPSGKAVFLRDVWPSNRDVQDVVERHVTAELFEKSYADVFVGDREWSELSVPTGSVYEWDEQSTYIQEPPFFAEMEREPRPPGDIEGARALVVVGDSITTDHISPAGAIPVEAPAGRFLIERGIDPKDFNSYGSRRGNDRVMVRGTFGNVRLRNHLTPDREGDWTAHLPDGEEMRIFDAAQRYLDAGTPLVVLAGKEYGMGSSRDWAAKGTLMLGVKAVLAESYECIHRSNLVGMGILPLLYKSRENRESLGLSGRERFDVTGVAGKLEPQLEVPVRATADDGSVTEFRAIVAIDSLVEVEYYRHGGILPLVLRSMLDEQLGQSPSGDSRRQ